MTKQDTIKEILFIPKEFYTQRNVSIFSLLKETGYFELYNQISEAEIFDLVIQYPECIEYWLNWSENKRVNAGWYFKQNDDGEYIVGYFPPKSKLDTCYTNINEACAAFIKKEIEDIRIAN